MTSCKSGVIRSHRRGPPGEEQPISTAYIPASGPSKATAHWINQDCSEFFGSFCSKIKKLSVSWLSARRAFSKSPQLKSDVLLEFPPAVMRQGQSRWGWGGVGADPLFRRSNSCCQVRPNRSIFVQLSREGIFPRSHPRRISSASPAATSRVQAYWPGTPGLPEYSSSRMRVGCTTPPARQAKRLNVCPCPWKGTLGTSWKGTVSPF